MGEETRERPTQYGGDLLNFASGLAVLYEKGLIQSGEVRRALHEWGLPLDERDAIDPGPVRLPIGRADYYRSRLSNADPTEWSRIVDEYLRREVGPV